MCGISGMIRFDRSVTGMAARARKMNARLRHRGPDGEGFLVIDSDGSSSAFFSDDTPSAIRESRFLHSPQNELTIEKESTLAIFGHRRLAIIDLSPAGHQPICSADGKTWITYNGEIYNYPELRTELESAGHQFLTQTDSEVVIAAWKQWGDNCLDRFNGMWSFVIWDSEKKIFFGARDRTGVKPFYYYKDEKIFSFASEQKALLTNNLVRTGLNNVAVADYFVSGEIEKREESFLKNIIELFPGHSFTLKPSGEFDKKQWYRPGISEEQPEYTETQYKQYIEEVRESLLQAVRLRLRSDVPVGSCLSGGIDSSAIVGIITHLIGNKEKVNIGDHLKLFTSVFREKEIDESAWAEKMVKRSNGDWNRVTPEPGELIRDLEELIFCQDVPIWSTSTYAQFRTMKLVHEKGIKVVLDGQGGDELFAGYHPYYYTFWRELKLRHRRTQARDEMRAFGENAAAFRKREYVKQRLVPSLPPRQQLLVQKNYFPDVKYLDHELLNTWCEHYQRQDSSPSLNAHLGREFFGARLKGYLKCEDRCSMWHSVESRTPFAEDHQLFEKVFRIPGTMKIRNGMSKYILREAARPFMPDEIADRKDKMGYVTPNNKWITELKDSFLPYFDSDLRGIIRKEKLLADYNSFFSVDGQPENGRVFKFAVFAIWRKVTGI